MTMSMAKSEDVLWLTTIYTTEFRRLDELTLRRHGLLSGRHARGAGGVGRYDNARIGLSPPDVFVTTGVFLFDTGTRAASGCLGNYGPELDRSLGRAIAELPHCVLRTMYMKS